MHSSPQIFWKAVLSDVREKYEKSKKGVFLVRKESCTASNKVKIRKISENSKKPS